MLRKEIQYGLMPTTLKIGTDQKQALMGLMNLFQYGGFFRDQNGLNYLPSIRELRQILKLPGDLLFKVKGDEIEWLCQKGKAFFIYLVYR